MDKDLGLHDIPLPPEVRGQSFVFPGQPRPVIPPIPDEVLAKNAVQVRAHAHAHAHVVWGC
jgi:hypothetical protein